MPDRPSHHRPTLTRREFVRAAAAFVALPSLERLVIPGDAQRSIDADLIGVSIARLHQRYDEKNYAASQVTRWYLQRTERYIPVYPALLHVDAAGAMARAAQLDAAARRSGRAQGTGALWGVPIGI